MLGGGKDRRLFGLLLSSFFCCFFFLPEVELLASVTKMPAVRLTRLTGERLEIDAVLQSVMATATKAVMATIYGASDRHRNGRTADKKVQQR